MPAPGIAADRSQQARQHLAEDGAAADTAHGAGEDVADLAHVGAADDLSND